MNPPPSLASPRRIVTGHDDAGKAIIAIDDNPPLRARDDGSEKEAKLLKAAVVWSSNQFPSDNTTMIGPENVSQHLRGHPDGGSVLRISDLGPGLSSPLHRTMSLDYAILLAGDHVEMELDDGVTVKLGVGDVVVQRGTIHAWHNRGSQWARFVFVLLDATPVRIGDRELSKAGL